MKGTIALVLAFACIFALYAEASAKAADSKAKDAKTKDAKDTKDDKEPSTTAKSVKDSAAKSAAKSTKDTKKSKKDCAKACGTTVNPVCAHDPKNSSVKPRTFSTQCALDVHNCENGSKLVVKNKGACASSSTKN